MSGSLIPSSQTPEEVATTDPLEQQDRIATRMLLALQRLAQQAVLYDAENDAQRRAIDEVADAAKEYGAATGRNVTIYFSERAVYVGRRLLRANRNIYASAAHVQDLLAAMGVSQITVGHDVPTEELGALRDALRVAQRERKAAKAPQNLSRIRLRVGKPPSEFAEFDELSSEERNVKVFALAVVIVRRFLESLRAGSLETPGLVRRISQQLVAVSEHTGPAFLNATVARPAHDDAGRAVSAALLALCIARQLTNDPRALIRLVMAALFFNVGRQRVAGISPTGGSAGRIPVLGLEQYVELPRATAAMTTALGKMTDAGMTRSVLIYEGLHQAHRQETGAPYDGALAPTSLARIIALCQRFQELLAESGKGPADVMATLTLMADARQDSAILRLMMAVLCVLPTGTLVELSTGDHAQVLSVPNRPGDLGRPVVQLTDEDGEALLRPVFLDLAEPRDGKPPPTIVRVVAMADEQRVRSARDVVLVPPESSAADDSDFVPQSERQTVKPAPRAPAQRAVTEPQIPPIHVSDTLIELAQRDDEIFIPVGPIDLDALDAVPLPSIPPPPTGRFESAPPTDRQPSTRPDGLPDSRHSLAPRIPADAEGSLAKTPLVNLLVYVLDRELTGTLLLQPERGRAAIYFVDGAPCKVRTPELVSPLDETLLRMGKIDESTVTDTLRAVARTKQLHGRYLVDNGYISEDELSAALRQQLVNKIGSMFMYAPDTRYAYFNDVDLLSDYGGATLNPCEPLVLIMMGARRFVSAVSIDEVLQRLGDAPLALHQTADPRYLGLNPAELAVIDALEQDAPSLETLLSRRVADDDIVRRLLYALLITRHIDLSGGTRTPVGFKPRRRA